MFIAIISDAFNETKIELEDEADVGVDTISKAVVRIVLHDFLYRVPIVGRWFSRAVTQAERRIDDLRHFAEKNLHVKDVSATHTVRCPPANHLTHATPTTMQLLALSDANADGTATAAELVATMDADSDGRVTANEMIAALVEVGTGLDEARELVDLLDRDHDGNLSTRELERLLQVCRPTPHCRALPCVAEPRPAPLCLQMDGHERREHLATRQAESAASRLGTIDESLSGTTPTNGHEQVLTGAPPTASPSAGSGTGGAGATLTVRGHEP